MVARAALRPPPRRPEAPAGEPAGGRGAVTRAPRASGVPLGWGRGVGASRTSNWPRKAGRGGAVLQAEMRFCGPAKVWTYVLPRLHAADRRCSGQSYFAWALGALSGRNGLRWSTR